jgi:hypothetical protein
LYLFQALKILSGKIRRIDETVIVLLGHEKPMRGMIKSKNGLSRFPCKNAVTIQGNKNDELMKMFRQNCLEKNYEISSWEVEDNVLKVLDKQQLLPSFKAVEMIVQSAADKAAVRSGDKSCIEIRPEDVQLDDPLSHLKLMYKLEGIHQQLTEMMNFLLVSRAEGSATPKVGHFVFKGSPGTGKTTVGRHLAEALFKLGFLKNNHMEECAGNHIIISYFHDLKNVYIVSAGPSYTNFHKNSSCHFINAVSDNVIN